MQLDSALGLVAVPGDSPEPTGVRRLFGSVALVDLDTPPTLVVPELSGPADLRRATPGGRRASSRTRSRTGSWYVVGSESDDVFTGEPDDLWRRVLRRQPEPLRWVAWFPSDPLLN